MKVRIKRGYKWGDRKVGVYREVDLDCVPSHGDTIHIYSDDSVISITVHRVDWILGSGDLGSVADVIENWRKIVGVDNLRDATQFVCDQVQHDVADGWEVWFRRWPELSVVPKRPAAVPPPLPRVSKQ